MRIKQKSFKFNKLVLLSVTLLVSGLIFLALELTGKTSLIFDRSEKVTEEEARTTSTAPTAQEDFTGGDNRIPNQASNSNEGTLTDNNGAVSSLPPRANWTSSSDGKITVYSPAKNSIITNGSEISGTSTYQKVNFRLIDDVSGVIMEGNLAVVNGTFSGKLNFETPGTNGRLDIFYSTNAGAESSNTEVPVRYK